MCEIGPHRRIGAWRAGYSKSARQIVRLNRFVRTDILYGRNDRVCCGECGDDFPGIARTISGAIGALGI